MITPTNTQAALAGLEMEKLPSLPHILVKMLEVCHDDNADFQQISRIVAQDVAITGRVLALANSPLYSSASNVSTLERALLVLGTDTLKTLIITVAVQQFFSEFGRQRSMFLKQFWRQSLSCALLSKSFAALTNYDFPEQAYLAGLLHNVGSLVLQSQFPERYQAMLDSIDEKNINESSIAQAEEREFGVNHCGLGAELLASWGLDTFTCDAVRYHHEATEQARDAHHLVKLVRLSALLSEDDAIGDPDNFQAADTLFGLTVPLTREIVLQIGTEVGRVAQSMGIDLKNTGDTSARDKKAMQDLAEQIKNIGLLQNAKQNLDLSGSREELNAHVTNTVELLFGVNNVLLFELNASADALVYQQGEERDTVDFKIPLQEQRSMISDAALQQAPVSSFDSSSADNNVVAVVDRQLIGLCGRKGMLCVPMVNEGVVRGVLVLGMDEPYKKEKQRLLSLFAVEVARAIETCDQQQHESDAESQAFKDGVENRLKEIAHEANNPLSIIRNYLELLALKLGDEHQAHNELGIIREEIDRTGQIILQLKDLGKVELNVGGEVNVNAELTDLVEIYKQSLFLTHAINCELCLDLEVPWLTLNRNPIKQVFTNLIKNAAEAMTDGGLITLTTSDKINHNGREYIEVVIADDGPGIPDKVRDNLFSPVTSSKGEGHSGLGLSICKRLISELGGSIAYRRAANKTEFKILLPRKIKK